MKRILRSITLLSAALLLLVVPVLAADGGMDKMIEQNQQNGKDECLLVAMECGSRFDSVQQRIDALRGEIARGGAVYSNEEMNRLRRQLEEAIRIQEQAVMGG